MFHRAIVAAALLITSAFTSVNPAQTIPAIAIVNARVFTAVDGRPWAEAVLVRGDRIVAVGTSEEVRAASGAGATIIDARGRVVVPGLNDAHTHPGAYPEGASLEGPPAMQEDPPLKIVLERLRAAAARAPKGGWVFGETGPAVFDDPGATRFALDAVAPDHLVALTSWTGHGTLFNSAALRHLGVSDREPDPAGGFFKRMPDGKTINGVAHEYAEYRLRQQMTMSVPRERQLTASLGFSREALGFGITTAQAMLTAGTPRFMSEFLVRDDVRLRIRLIDMPMGDPGAWTPARAAAGAATPGVKVILDGTPLERLAAMRRPYADAATSGRLNFTTNELSAFLRRAFDAGIQPMVHVAGDRAMDATLDALESTGGEKWRALRPRLEHGEMLQPDQYERVKRLGAVLVINPSHFMVGPVLQTRLGAARTATFGAVKSALGAGIPIAIGSDGPLNPFLNIMFAVSHPGSPQEALSREQAVLAYTKWSAYAELQEKDKGTLAPGMLADLAMLSQDIFTVPVEALPGTTSVMTMVGGRVVHEVK